MPMDRHAKRLVEMIAAGQREEATAPSAESLRRSMTRLAEAADIRHVPVGHVEDRVVPSDDASIPIRIYTPCDAEAAPLPCIVYFHGGTGVFCDISTHDGLCRLLANSSGCRVISVGYRRAPEHPFPYGLNDCMAATAWVSSRSAELHI